MLSRRHAASLSRPELLAAIIGRALVLDRPAREQRRMSRRALGSPTDYRLPRALALAACGVIGRALVLDRPAREQRRMSRRALGSPTDYRLPRALAACGDCVHPKAPEGVTMPLSFMAEQCAAEQQAAERRAIPGA